MEDMEDDDESGCSQCGKPVIGQRCDGCGVDLCPDCYRRGCDYCAECEVEVYGPPDLSDWEYNQIHPDQR